MSNTSGLAPKNDTADKKPDASLIPMDILIEFLVPAYEEGLIKYDRESWRRGFQVSRLEAAARRHMTAFFNSGEDFDPEAAALGVKKHHLAGAVFSLLSILHTLKYHPELDDRKDPVTGAPLSKDNTMKINPSKIKIVA